MSAEDSRRAGGERHLRQGQVDIHDEGSTNSADEAPMVGTLVSVNVGMPKDVAWEGRTVHSGVFKYPVSGAAKVRRLNIDGDGQGDLAGHGGEQRAVLVYQSASYEHWRRHLDRSDLEPGMFGENFTVDGLPDDEVCIGDQYEIGDAVFEVTQPRVTCFRIGMRLGEPQMAALLVGHRRPGFYLRVLEEGSVRAGDSIRKRKTGLHRISVAATDALLYLPDRDEELLRKAVEVPALSPGWRESFEELLATDPKQATAAGPTLSVEPAWDGFRPMTVTRLEHETSQILSIYLEAGAGIAAETTLPGQYLTLQVPMGPNETAIRSYSISEIPQAHTYRVSVKREEHGLVSRRLHTGLRVGDRINVAAPRGEFILDEDGNPVVLLSAGVGATPVMAMLHQLAECKSEVPVWWIHTARTRNDEPFREEANRLLLSLPNGRAARFYTRETQPFPDAVDGRPSLAGMRALGLPANSVAYVCGPASFITDMTALLRQLGLAGSAIHSEIFAALAPINPGVVGPTAAAPHQPVGPLGSGPSVTFARSALIVRWRESDTSVLTLAEACDVPTRWVCRSGVCHTCTTGLISGTVDYHPQPLEPPPNGQALICCARPTRDLVLDL